MKIGSFSAHNLSLAYYIVPFFFSEQLEAYFLPSAFSHKSYCIRSDEIWVIRLGVCSAHTKIGERLRCVS
jgi:hypothetical protein